MTRPRAAWAWAPGLAKAAPSTSAASARAPISLEQLARRMIVGGVERAGQRVGDRRLGRGPQHRDELRGQRRVGAAERLDQAVGAGGDRGVAEPGQRQRRAQADLGGVVAQTDRERVEPPGASSRTPNASAV
ncbi:MAG: hypothetical protein IPL61_39100 [Myxococcales bacterium]|nr:hypothetical protein [Myxococcales bacterium]